jgi:hypothetical protein
MVDNPINRHSLVPDVDSSIEISIQKTALAGHESN